MTVSVGLRMTTKASGDVEGADAAGEVFILAAHLSSLFPPDWAGGGEGAGAFMRAAQRSSFDLPPPEVAAVETEEGVDGEGEGFEVRAFASPAHFRTSK